MSNATVTGSGTQADPWEFTFVSATTDAFNNYRQLALHYDVQSYVGRLAPREDSRVYERFYRLSDPDAAYIFNADGSPALISATTVIPPRLRLRGIFRSRP